MNLICKDCNLHLDRCQCTEKTLHVKEIIIADIESRILAEWKKHSRSLPNDWAKIAAHKIYATHFTE